MNTQVQRQVRSVDWSKQGKRLSVMDIRLETVFQDQIGKWTFEKRGKEKGCFEPSDGTWNENLEALTQKLMAHRRSDILCLCTPETHSDFSVSQDTPSEQPTLAREDVCSLDSFLTFCLKNRFCQNNKNKLKNMKLVYGSD